MKKVIKLTLVILWMLVIFCFSNQTGDESGKVSEGLIVKVANIMVDDNLTDKKRQEVVDKYVIFTRKLAHFSIYLILGILVINLLIEFNIKNIFLLSLLGCLLYAASDEVHQLFIPGRSGEVRDVLIDTIGSCVGICSYFVIKNKFKIKKQ